MKQLTFTLALIFMAIFCHSQIIDRYGINIGTSYTTQIWDYKLVSVDEEHDYKLGLQAFIQVEKDLGDLFALRTEFGYIQKGFKNNRELITSDGSEVGTNNDNVVLHDLALNLGLKVSPLETSFAPYLLVGLRGDYMVSYKDTEFEEPGSGLKFNIYETFLEDFNEFNVGGLIGLGLDFKRLIYVEIEYNPSFTKNLDDSSVSIRDESWGAKIGLNLNQIIQKK